jgi:myo-inositol-1(or 4)-monophosphatase
VVREIAQREVTPRFLKVAHSHKVDGSLFTEADSETQAALEAALPHIKDVPVLGEEMTEQQQRDAWDAGRDGLWCVDPIDGTSNFVAGVPYFAVSVAYLYKGERQLGVVYDPIADEMFSAERGRGAHLNGEPLPLRTPVTELRRALAGVEMKRIDRELAGRLAAWPPYASQRNFGASTLDWCYTAAGTLRHLCPRRAETVGLRRRRADPGRGGRAAGQPVGQLRHRQRVGALGGGLGQPRAVRIVA